MLNLICIYFFTTHFIYKNIWYIYLLHDISVSVLTFDQVSWLCWIWYLSDNQASLIHYITITSSFSCTNTYDLSIHLSLIVKFLNFVVKFFLVYLVSMIESWGKKTPVFYSRQKHQFFIATCKSYMRTKRCQYSLTDSWVN